MSFPAIVVNALGEERALAVGRATEKLLDLTQSLPAHTTAVVHVPVPLAARTASAATRELAERIRRHDPDGDWQFATAVLPDGSRFGKASPFLQSRPAGTDAWFTHFLLSDLHTRLGAWWLTQVWRSAELASSARDALGEWHVLAAAASARSLMEGAAALTVGAAGLQADWDQFKRSGQPTLHSLEPFAAQLNDRITKLQYASRVDQEMRKGSPLLSQSVAYYIKKLAQDTDSFDVNGIYDWLCDAVHPSFGSGTAYLVYRGMDDSQTHLVERYARHPLELLEETDFALVPTVAQAAADAIRVAGDVLLRDLPRVRWVLDDLGLTSGVAFQVGLSYVGRHPRPGPASACPCRSGRPFQECQHSWGASGLPDSA